jgi:hypothetical protein
MSGRGGFKGRQLDPHRGKREVSCDAAVIDINLGGETSEPVALGLDNCAIPFVTVPGYSSELLPPVFNGIRVLTKPLGPELLAAELKRRKGKESEKGNG